MTPEATPTAATASRLYPQFQNFGTTVSHVKVSAPVLSLDSLQLTLSLFDLRSCHVKSGRSITALSVALLELTLSSKLSDAKNSTQVLLSSKSTLRFATIVFGLYSSLWFRLHRRTLSPSSRRFEDSLM